MTHLRWFLSGSSEDAEGSVLAERTVRSKRVQKVTTTFDTHRVGGSSGIRGGRRPCGGGSLGLLPLKSANRNLVLPPLKSANRNLVLPPLKSANRNLVLPPLKSANRNLVLPPLKSANRNLVLPPLKSANRNLVLPPLQSANRNLVLPPLKSANRNLVLPPLKSANRNLGLLSTPMSESPMLPSKLLTISSNEIHLLALFSPRPSSHNTNAKRISEGAFGQVLKVTHERSGVDYAVKVLPVLKEEDKERVSRQVEMLTRFAHPRIVGLHESIDMGGYQAIVMELGCVFTHGDIKPENVLFHPNNRAFLCDLGGSAAFEQHLTQRTGEFGTFEYNSPERVMDSNGTATPANDVWSLGVLAYRMVTGRGLFDELTLPQLCLALGLFSESKIPTTIPAAVRGVLVKMLEPNAALRATTTALLEGGLLEGMLGAETALSKMMSIQLATGVNEMKELLNDARVKEKTMELETEKAKLLKETIELEHQLTATHTSPISIDHEVNILSTKHEMPPLQGDKVVMEVNPQSTPDITRFYPNDDDFTDWTDDDNSENEPSTGSPSNETINNEFDLIVKIGIAGDKYHLSVYPHNTIIQIKERLASFVGQSIDDISLMYGPDLLSDSTTLSKIDFCENHTMIAFINTDEQPSTQSRSKENVNDAFSLMVENTSTGDQYNLNVVPFNTILEIKLRLGHYVDVWYREISLLFEAEELKDYKTLSEINFNGHFVLHLSINKPNDQIDVTAHDANTDEQPSTGSPSKEGNTHHTPTTASSSTSKVPQKPNPLPVKVAARDHPAYQPFFARLKGGKKAVFMAPEMREKGLNPDALSDPDMLV
ncbi:hypothetical protein BLNAU_11195 [Blattamonas nauphoetae]|uniref:Non-specific serine/threonine protein kinase n=1 Tax=Blattamonas nauphoetae TaxID=2049346 RepID=A0ABQ9XQT3_9EUKA|nr:hypothetical protein BLNAU_11195 [Blattamonas nauphoetae]